MICGKCGHKHPPDGQFCPFCGAKHIPVSQPKNERESFWSVLAVPLFFMLLLILGIFAYVRSAPFVWDAATLPKIETAQASVPAANVTDAK